MTSLRLERAAAVRWRQLLITPFPPQNVKVNVYSLMWWRKCGPIGPPPWENGGISGHRCRTRLPKMSLEPPWKDTATDGLLKTAMKIRIYKHPTHPDQRPLRPQTLFRHTHTFSCQIHQYNRAAPVRYCVDLLHSKIITGAVKAQVKKCCDFKKSLRHPEEYLIFDNYPHERED